MKLLMSQMAARVSRLFTKPAFQPDAFYTVVCCIVKDENAYLNEWLQYHLSIGVEYFFIYDNGSKVPVRQTVSELGLSDVVTVTEIRGRNKHVTAYQHCLNYYGDTSHWIAFIDTDEFLVPKSTQGDLPAFLKQYEQYGGLGVSWLIFGSNGHVAKPKGSQLESFTKRSETTFLANQHIKSIVQPRYVRSAFKSHCFKYKPDFFCVNEHGKKVEESFSESSIETIQLNHYYCRSLEEYRDKVQRGISDTKRERKIDEFYYHDSMSNIVEDTAILEVVNRMELIK